jgi:hypothetical protein
MAEALELLRAAGIAKTVVSGPAAIAAALQEKSIVRPIGWFDILMPREAVGAAVNALNVAGWRLENEAGLRRGAVPDFLEGVFLKRGDADRMRLCWRLHLGPEGKERWPGVVRSHHRGMALDCPGVEDQLAQAAGSHDRDGVPWECDAFLITRGEEVQWPEVARKLRWDPEGLRRLQTLPDYAVNEHERGPGTLKLHYQMLWRDYCLAEWSRGIAVSAGPWRNRKGLIRFLGERWGTPVWQLPFQGLRRILRHSL